MKKATVTLESLDSRADVHNSKIEALDKKIETSIKALDTRFDRLEKYVSEFFDFIRENMMLRKETQEYVDERIDTKFTKYTSDQFEFQDHVGKRCENVEHETLALQHRVTLVEKHIGI
ncbi:hypothetical protein A2318_01095 [Candidatus Uhrbacteria bacterium RIFOXYB2_FULL_45_11]|uniref:Uncharacterized protein n=1 Tax=Candidatus Uhrbacteria bacterium RIFOXYB2_FULL_45_11 TaxID=1802421 RepID=A0A1F7W9Y0_9BACT|nr:MAG: hypothetical protein A2318_01095 [Candidatus Uhrbacteria bacterium RIFOXYB2_FULL_45_11]